ncbi:MAG: LamG-like jellyroll fold domain-containing protein [Pseudomonadota bacterium]
MPVFEIWNEGSLFNSYSISSAGTSIIETITFAGSVPTSLEFRFNDALPEPGRQIEIRSVQINNQYLNTGNFLSADLLNNGQTSTVNVTTGNFIFDDSEPAASVFTTGATQTFTAGVDRFVQFTSSSDEVFTMLNGRDVAYLGSGNDTVSGGDGNDILRGGGGADLLYGDLGNDRLFGQDGNDEIFGGDGDDLVHGNDGNDRLFGNDGADRLVGHVGDDLLVGGAGNDRLSGSAGEDNLFGGDNNDTLNGGTGNDTLDGGSGEDLLFGGSGNDIINGGADNDTIYGQGDDDTISGNEGSDTIRGNDGNDTIYGNEGNDFLFGNIGDDVIDGGSDNDEIEGGEGNDTVNGGDGIDTISGDGDDLDVVMEAGSIAVTQLNGTQWHSVNFTSNLTNAVVKLFANDITGDPFTTRVRNITSTGFEFQLDEYDYLDGATALENISWIAIEEGSHTLTNGITVEAGFVSATNENSSTVNFASGFTVNPVVFSQLSSDNDLSAAATRNRGVSTAGFTLEMNEEEAADGVHATEDIGWLAIEAGGSALSGFLVSTTGDVVTQNTTTVNFGGTFGATPVFVADMQTDDGGDTAVTAGTGILTTTGTEVYIDEEQSNDTEIGHTTENVGYIALNAGEYSATNFVNGSDVLRGGAGADTIYADVVGVSSSVINSLSAVILADAPIAYWSLNDSGTVADNLGSTGSIDGTLNNGVLTNQNALYVGGSESMAFDGTNDYIFIPNSPDINENAQTLRTVELVFRADTLTGRQVLYEEGGGTNALTIYLDGANIYFNVRDSGEFGPFTITTGITAGVTYHAAAVFDSVTANSFTGYLDGVFVGSGTTATDLDPHTGEIAIGRQSGSNFYHDGAQSGDSNHFDGFISDVALYNSALTAADIQERADIVSGTLSGPVLAIDDMLYGGDGLDMLYGGSGRDSFVFESGSAFNDVDQIFNFSYGERDSIDISDLLTGYTSGVSDINDFVQFTTSGNNTLVGIDADGTGGYTNIAQINNIVGLDVDTMLANQQIID